MRCRWRAFPTINWKTTWASSSPQECAWPSASKSRIPSWPGIGPPRSHPGRHAGTVTDDALLDPRQSNYLAAVAPGEPVGNCLGGDFHGPVRGRGLSAEPIGRSTCPHRSRRVPAGGNGPPLPARLAEQMMVTRRPAWVFAEAAAETPGQAFRHGRPGRFRLRPRPRGSPGRPSGRGDPRLSHGDPEDVAGPHRPAGALPRPAARWRSTRPAGGAWRSPARSAKAAAKARCWPCSIGPSPRWARRLLADWVANPLTELEAIETGLTASAS